MKCQTNFILNVITEADKRTMNKLKQMANNILPSIQVKIDVPSDHQNRRLPILDTELWIEEVEVNGVKKIKSSIPIT